MVFRWRDEHTEAFLDNYRKYQCLWNVSNESYKNKLERDKSYVQLCNDMEIPGLTVGDIKNKIKTIRTNYKNELTKIIRSEKSGSGCAEIYVPRLFWFKKADEFLRGVCEAKASTSNLNSEASVAAVDNDSSLQSDADLQEDIVVTHAPTRSTVSPRSPQSGNTTKQKRAMKRPSNLSSIQSSVDKLEKISKNCQEDDEDEFDLFGKSIAVQLKKMPLDRALICQENLQAVMKKERLYQFNGGFVSPTDKNQPHPSYRTISVAASPAYSHESHATQSYLSPNDDSEITLVSLENENRISIQPRQDVLSQAISGINW